MQNNNINVIIDFLLKDKNISDEFKAALREQKRNKNEQ